MCRCLNIPRASYYYKAIEPKSEAELEEMIKTIFRESKSRYGARKLKKCLENEGIILSRRRIRRIMKRLYLVSVYQKATFKSNSKGKNEAPIPNLLARQFDYDNAVSESTYRAFKLEFVNQENFHSLKELTFKTKDYVYWWNHHRIHSSLNYQTPIAKRIST